MESSTRWLTMIKLLVMSSMGIIAFFVPIDFNGKSTILLDHGSDFIIKEMRPVALIFIMLMMAYGGLSPFIYIGPRKGQSGRGVNIHLQPHFDNLGTAIFALFKLLGFGLAVLYMVELFMPGFAPAWMMHPSLIPFLFEKLALAVGILIPLGSLGLTFLIGFGLLEMVGVLMEKVMRPLFRTPGYSSVDAVTSFVGSYSIGLLITNKMYMRGRYSFRDAVITATGFSTVSATFMVVVAKTLGLMDFWNFYFWATFVVTFTVTAITAYLPPISGMDNTYGEGADEEVIGNRISHAINTGISHYRHRASLMTMLRDNLKDGLRMSAVVAPSILAVGFIGLCISKYTPLFDWLGFVLKPVLLLVGMILDIENAAQTSGAFASVLAEMFLPAILLKDHPEVALRFVAAIVSVSSVLFFSGCIPCILATTIPVKIKDLLVIWLIRTVLSIFFASLIVRLGLQMGWVG